MQFSYTKIVAIFFLLVGYSFSAMAQKTNFDKIVQPIDVRAKDYRELLVQLAWLNNPDNENLANAVIIERERIGLEKQNWLNNLTGSFNVNEGNISQQSNSFFPRYNLNITMSVGTLLATPKKVKIAKEQVKMAENKVNQQKLKIRAEVLERYENYLSAIEILTIRTQAVEDMRTLQTLVVQKFEQGLSTVEEYTEALKAYNQAAEAKALAENNVKLTKLMVEEMIGLPLEEIMPVKKFDTTPNPKYTP